MVVRCPESCLCGWAPPRTYSTQQEVDISFLLPTTLTLFFAGRHSVALPELGRILLLAAGASRLCVEAIVSALARECGASLLPVDLNFLETLTTAALGTQPKRPEAQEGGFMALLVSAFWSGGKHAFALDIVRAFCKRVRECTERFGLSELVWL